MAKDKGEPEKGTHCSRCNKIVRWHEKKRISIHEYQKTDISLNQREKVIDRFNLCNVCYSEWKRLMYKFLNTGGKE